MTFSLAVTINAVVQRLSRHFVARNTVSVLIYCRVFIFVFLHRVETRAGPTVPPGSNVRHPTRMRGRSWKFPRTTAVLVVVPRSTSGTERSGRKKNGGPTTLGFLRRMVPITRQFRLPIAIL